MTNETFLVIGSVTDPYRVREVGDIDLVVPECTDDRAYTTPFTLEPYERLAEATGKPIDLKFTTNSSDLNLTGLYEPGGRWQFIWLFCGNHWFSNLHVMTFDEVVGAVRRSAARATQRRDDAAA